MICPNCSGRIDPRPHLAKEIDPDPNSLEDNDAFRCKSCDNYYSEAEIKDIAASDILEGNTDETYHTLFKHAENVDKKTKVPLVMEVSADIHTGELDPLLKRTPHRDSFLCPCCSMPIPKGDDLRKDQLICPTCETASDINLIRRYTGFSEYVYVYGIDQMKLYKNGAGSGVYHSPHPPEELVWIAQVIIGGLLGNLTTRLVEKGGEKVRNKYQDLRREDTDPMLEGLDDDILEALDTSDPVRNPAVLINPEGDKQRILKFIKFSLSGEFYLMLCGGLGDELKVEDRQLSGSEVASVFMYSIYTALLDTIDMNGEMRNNFNQLFEYTEED